MLRSFLLSGFRSLKKDSLFSVLNIITLAISLGSVFVIVAYLWNENSIDSFHKNSEKVKVVTLLQKNENSSREVGLTTLEIGDFLLKENPEVEDVLTIRRVLGSTLLFHKTSQATTSSITLADDNFFRFFDFSLLRGDPNTALLEPNSIILEKNVSEALFGDNNPLGKTVETRGAVPMKLKVTGVIESTNQSHLNIYSLISLNTRMDDGQKISDWYKYSVYNYIKTQQPESSEKLYSAINARFAKKFPGQSDQLRFYSIENAYFDLFGVEFLSGFNTGNQQSLTILSLVVLLILTIAIVNFVNITISMSIKRVKEIGIRKIMGAKKGSLNLQVIIETSILILISTFLALTLSHLFIFYNADFLSNTMSEEVYNHPFLLLSFLAIILFVIGVSSVYPAFFINRLNLLSSLKNTIDGKSNRPVRNILLGIQFSITLGLTILSLVVYCQQKYLHQKPVGFDRDQVTILPIDLSSKVQSNYRVLENELKSLPYVESVSVSTDALGYGYTNTSYYAIKKEQTDPENNGVMATYFHIDENFLPTYGLEIMEGRNFRKELSSDSAAVVINEKMAEKMGLNDPLNHQIKLFGVEDISRRIIGVVKDFNFQSLHKPIEPAAFVLTDRNFWSLAIRHSPEDELHVIRKSKEIWTLLDPDTPFEYQSLDHLLSGFYQSERKFNRLISIFTLISIILSVSGLFGLTAFMVERNLKSLSIRKVLGANPLQLIRQLSGHFILIYLIAVIFTLPVSIWIESKWLSNFAYRIENTWWIYAGAGIGIILLILLTISLTSRKAIVSNPARFLRDE